MKFVLEKDNTCAVSVKLNGFNVPTLYFNDTPVAYFVNGSIEFRALTPETVDRLELHGVYSMTDLNGANVINHYAQDPEEMK